MINPALLTDRYELTMLDSALADGTADRRVAFEAYCRSLPAGIDRGVAAGSRRIVEAVLGFHFDDVALAFLRSNGVVTDNALDWLADYRFGGSLTVMADGHRFDIGVPVVTVDGTFAEAVILETLILSILNSSFTIATHAAAMRRIVGPRPTLIEMGSRRIHELAAVEAAYAAYVGGFDATSNLEAGRRYNIPTTGTAAHSWTLLHDEESQAFRAQLLDQGQETTLLVDTFDPHLGIANAVATANSLGFAGPGAIRLDSGDLLTGAIAAREQLDSLGAESTRIVVSGDLDLDELARLTAADAPIDAYGVGTRLVAAAPLGFVYKLVAVGDDADTMRPVAKKSADPSKSTVGGRKIVTVAPNGSTHAIVPGEHSTKKIERGKPDVRVLAIDEGEPVDLPPEFTSAAAARRVATRRRALIAVDIQNDFCEGGSLAVSGGAEVARRMAAFVDASAADFDLLVSTRDIHTEATAGHFADSGEDPDYSRTWPVHCMTGTSGADYHSPFNEMVAKHRFVEIVKGQKTAAYSGFDGVVCNDPETTLSDLLSRERITDIFIGGIATDYCVRATGLDSIEHLARTTDHGRVVLLADLCAAVAARTGVDALTELASAGVRIDGDPNRDPEVGE